MVGAGDLRGLVGPCDPLNRALSREGGGMGLRGGWRSGPGSGAPLAAAAAPLRGLPRGVEPLPQRSALPAQLLRPRRAAGLRAVAARPGQLPRVGGAPERRGPGALGRPGVVLGRWSASPGHPNARATPPHVRSPGTLERSIARDPPPFMLPFFPEIPKISMSTGLSNTEIQSKEGG